MSNVDHPSHYNKSGMETIDEMVLMFGKAKVLIWMELNIYKYRARALYKNGEEDMQKAAWYIQKYKELKEGC